MNECSFLIALLTWATFNCKQLQIYQNDIHFQYYNYCLWILVILMDFMLASILGPVDPNHSGLAPNAFLFSGKPISVTGFQEFLYTIKSRTTEVHSTSDLQCTRDILCGTKLVTDLPVVYFYGSWQIRQSVIFLVLQVFIVRNLSRKF